MQRIVLNAVLLISLLGARAAHGWDTETIETRSGITLEYVLVTPANFDAARPWPVLLALSGGVQDGNAVLGGLRAFWGEQAASRGWVVVSPLAPGEQPFFQGSEALLPELLDEIAAQVQVEGGLFHLAGTGTGGLSAFRAAIETPERFASLVVFPGGPANAKDVARLDRLTGLPVRMFAGTADEEYLRLMEASARQMDRLGIDVQALPLKGEGLPPKSVDADVLFEVLEQVRQAVASKGAPGLEPGFDSASSVLDGLQVAAARGNGRAFFDCFSEDAIVYWLDPDARWSRADLAERLQPRFGAGERLRFASIERDLTPLPGGGAMVFDEKLASLELGRCRSQGVLVEREGAWRILRYGLDCAAQVVLPSMGP